MDDQITCFLSYCYEDVDKDTIKYLIQYISTVNKKIKILYDEDLGYGRSFKNFMDMIENVNGVIVLYSPNYKMKVLNRKDGVDYEFKQIKARFEKELQRKIKGDEDELDNEGSIIYSKNQIYEKNFVLIPILFSGTPGTSIPHECKEWNFN